MTDGRTAGLLLLSDVLGAGESQAEGEGGAGETAGSAGALQEVFDITPHSLGQGAGQRPHAEVTSRGGVCPYGKARHPSARKALEGGPRVLLPVSFLTGWLDSVIELWRASLKNPLLVKTAS